MNFNRNIRRAKETLEYTLNRKKNCLKFAIEGLEYYIFNYKRDHPEIKTVSEVKKHLSEYIENIAERLVWNGEEYKEGMQPESIIDNASL